MSLRLNKPTFKPALKSNKLNVVKPSFPTTQPVQQSPAPAKPRAPSVPPPQSPPKAAPSAFTPAFDDNDSPAIRPPSAFAPSFQSPPPSRSPTPEQPSTSRLFRAPSVLSNASFAQADQNEPSDNEPEPDPTPVKKLDKGKKRAIQPIHPSKRQKQTPIIPSSDLPSEATPKAPLRVRKDGKPKRKYTRRTVVITQEMLDAAEDAPDPATVTMAALARDDGTGRMSESAKEEAIEKIKQRQEAQKRRIDAKVAAMRAKMNADTIPEDGTAPAPTRPKTASRTPAPRHNSQRASSVIAEEEDFAARTMMVFAGVGSGSQPPSRQTSLAPIQPGQFRSPSVESRARSASVLSYGTQAGREDSEMPEDEEEQEEEGEEEGEEDEEAEERHDHAAPQMRIVDGQIVVDEQTLQINQNNDRSIIEARQITEHVDADKKKRFVNSATWGKRKKVARWTAEEEQIFYDALQMFGTDFETISKLFLGRDRAQIKRKYVRESKVNPEAINQAFTTKKPIDKTFFTKMTDQSFEGPTPVDPMSKYYTDLPERGAKLESNQKERLEELEREQAETLANAQADAEGEAGGEQEHQEGDEGETGEQEQEAEQEQEEEQEPEPEPEPEDDFAGAIQF